MSRAAGARLGRLLALVPYLLAHPGSAVTEVAAAFGVSEATLADDLQLLFVCGLPGHLPDDLIEADLSEGTITLGNAEVIARPLRLSPDEALTLLVGLRALATLPALTDTDVLLRTLAKLEHAAGGAGAAMGQVAVELAQRREDPSVVAVLRDALRAGRRLHLRYYVPGRDETTERDVDPLRLVIVEGHSYLQGWCYRSEGLRTFRVDRMLHAEVLSHVVAPPAGGDDVLPTLPEVGSPWFTASELDVRVVLELSPRARWVSENYPCEVEEERADGGLRVLLRTADPQWVRRLALRLGADARVLEPASLVVEIAAAARTALEAYRGDEPDRAAGAEQTG